jgi:8-oxo-dGTP pyrophosphatase MutT (NUDIX family)
MPGGALEVGETAAQGVCREALEETGIRCLAVALAGVFDSRLCGSISRHHLYHFVFICQPLEDQPLDQPIPNEEALEVRWFDLDKLPSTDELDPGHAIRIPQVIEVWRKNEQPYFD